MTKTVKEIKERIEEYYGVLYQEKHVEEEAVNGILKNIETKIDRSAFFTQDFNLLELHKCVSSFKRGKSAGKMGFHLNFTQPFGTC